MFNIYSLYKIPEGVALLKDSARNIDYINYSWCKKVEEFWTLVILATSRFAWQRSKKGDKALEIIESNQSF